MKKAEEKIRKLESQSNNRVVRRLEAPLSKPEIKRLERKLGYEKTKDEISDWQPTVNRLREADVVTFPLKNEDVPETTTKLSERLKPQTELEKSISAILQESGIDVDSIRKFEELAVKESSMEEEQARQAQLAKLRAAMQYRSSNSL